MNSPPCQLLEWDTRFFGLPIARVAGDRLTRSDWARVLDWCTAKSIRCLYLLVSAEDTESSLVAGEEQFRAVDIRMTLDRRICGEGACDAIRPAREDDIPALVDLARESHRDSRFFADPGFPEELCRRLYETWIEKSCRGYAKSVLVADMNDKPAGYITCDWSADTGHIGLVAVAPWAQGEGVGKALVNASLHTFRDNGVRRIHVTTQGRNIPAQRLYQRCGFLTRSVQIWHHRWF
jgi:dTDP-4-amino-4,6-dideoxy-D-galactose acyltransferase